MLSFKILDGDSFADISASLGKELGAPEVAEEILASFLEIADEGCEVGISAAYGMLLVRILDGGRYSFVYPIEVAEDTDADGALISLAEYAMREMIPFHMTDAPREELDRIGRLFPHVEARAYDDDVDSFVVLIYSECDLVDELPAVELDGVLLNELCDADMASYAKLARNEAVNRFWGYDYKADAEGADDAYFLETARMEIAQGIALSFAIREGADEELLGEAVIFDFDYRGGAKLAVRLLPEAQGRRIGSRALAALIKLVGEIGVKMAYAEVRLENEPSIRMTSRYMQRGEDKDGKATFSLSIK